MRVLLSYSLKVALPFVVEFATFCWTVITACVLQASSISIMLSRDSGKIEKETDFTNLLFSRGIFLNRPQRAHLLKRNILIIGNKVLTKTREATVE